MLAACTSSSSSVSVSFPSATVDSAFALTGSCGSTGSVCGAVDKAVFANVDTERFYDCDCVACTDSAGARGRMATTARFSDLHVRYGIHVGDARRDGEEAGEKRVQPWMNQARRCSDIRRAACCVPMRMIIERYRMMGDFWRLEWRVPTPDAGWPGFSEPVPMRRRWTRSCKPGGGGSVRTMNNRICTNERTSRRVMMTRQDRDVARPDKEEGPENIIFLEFVSVEAVHEDEAASRASQPILHAVVEGNDITRPMPPHDLTVPDTYIGATPTCMSPVGRIPTVDGKITTHRKPSDAATACKGRDHVTSHPSTSSTHREPSDAAAGHQDPDHVITAFSTTCRKPSDTGPALGALVRVGWLLVTGYWLLVTG
ncbi:hypothetical protein GGX14DRAFT_408950 [Mycena pura]|uniref:Uncharacterized protein n=1 Tax=Mycena pura TaxID=153505 RepID=A0AAD6UPK0_9AGAR|nr:hypothetical protein GGX14DRAFT_408950 [Mycena pura]